jgi:HEAT repeat protein
VREVEENDRVYEEMTATLVRLISQSFVSTRSASLATITQALKEADATLRAQAAAILGKLGGEEAIEPLLSALNDVDWRTRRNAIVALGDVGDTRAVEAIRPVLKDSNPAVQKAARTALSKLNQRDT